MQVMGYIILLSKEDHTSMGAVSDQGSAMSRSDQDFLLPNPCPGGGLPLLWLSNDRDQGCPSLGLGFPLQKRRAVQVCAVPRGSAPFVRRGDWRRGREGGRMEAGWLRAWNCMCHVDSIYPWSLDGWMQAPRRPPTPP